MATVYRALANFEKVGILVKSTFEDGKAVFEINEGIHHDHLICMECGEVEEFVDEEIERRQKEIAARKGFTLKSHSLALYGSCNKPDCAHKSENKYYYAKRASTLEERVLELISLNESLRKVNRDLVSNLIKSQMSARC